VFLYVERPCRWRALPTKFGNGNTLYCRFRYWIEHGVFDRIEKELQTQAIAMFVYFVKFSVVRVKIDFSSVKQE